MEATETASNDQAATPESDSTETGQVGGNGKGPIETDGKTVGLTPAEKLKFKFKSKIDGVEEDIELDEDTIRRDYQKWKAADKRFQESSQMRKQFEETYSNLRTKEGLIQALRDLGHDPRALAEEHLAGELEFQMMSPEQKRLRELEFELAQRKQTDQQRAAQEKAAQEKEAVNRLTGQLQTEVIDALKVSNLPQNPQMVSRMAQQMKVHLQKGIDISAKEAAALVQKELLAEARAVYPKMPLATLKEIIGQDMVNGLLKDSLAQVKDPVQRTQKVTDSVSDRLNSNKEKKAYVSPKDFDKYMQKFRGQR